MTFTRNNQNGKVDMTLLSKFLEDTKAGTSTQGRKTCEYVPTETMQISGTHGKAIYLASNSPKEDNLSDIRHAFYPLYMSMRCFGLLWRNRVNWLKRDRCTVDLCTIHCSTILILAWISVLKYFVTYQESDKYGTILFQKVGRHIYCLQLAFGITSHVYHRYELIYLVELSWNKKGFWMPSALYLYFYMMACRLPILLGTCVLSSIILAICRPSYKIRCCQPLTFLHLPISSIP